MRPRPLQLAITLAVLALPPFAAADCSITSATHRVSLVELYTSEGCSSCPPADEWLSRLGGQGLAGKTIVPLALHVDYWDYIGWHDRFAQPGFSARQRELAAVGRSSVIYTPQVVFNGHDFRSWWNAGRVERELAAAGSSKAQASISLNLQVGNPGAFTVTATAGTVQAGPHALYLAVYENGLHSDVNRGENAGATLHHDFVVRKWLGPLTLNNQARLSWRQEIELDGTWKPDSLGVAAFVQNTATGEVLQAVSLPLCGHG